MLSLLIVGAYSFLPDQSLKISISSRGYVTVPELRAKGSDGDLKRQQQNDPSVYGKLKVVSFADHTKFQLEISRNRKSPLNSLLFATIPAIEEKDLKQNRDGVVKDKLFVSGTYAFLEVKNNKPLFENWTGKDAGSLTGPLWILPTMFSVPYRLWKSPNVEQPFEVYNDEGTSYRVITKKDTFNSSDKSLTESYQKYTFRVVRSEPRLELKYENYVTGNVIFNIKSGAIYKLVAGYDFADGPSSDYKPSDENTAFLRSVSVQITGELTKDKS